MLELLVVVFVSLVCSWVFFTIVITDLDDRHTKECNLAERRLRDAKQNARLTSGRYESRIDQLERQLSLQQKLASMAVIDAATMKHLVRDLHRQVVVRVDGGGKLLMCRKDVPHFEVGAKVSYSGQPAIVLGYDEFGRPVVSVPERGIVVPALDMMLKGEAGSVENADAVAKVQENADCKPSSVGASLCCAGSCSGSADACQRDAD